MVQIRPQHFEGFKILLDNLKDYKKPLIYLSCLSVVSAAANSSVPYLAGRLIDSILKGGSEFYTILLIWLALKIVADIFDWRIGLGSGRLNTILDADYFATRATSALYFPISFHKKYRLGEVLDRLSRATHNIAEITTSIIVELAPQFLSIIFALIFTFYIKAVLAAILVVAVVLYVFIVLRISPRLSLLFPKMNKAYNRAWGDTWEALGNIATVKQAVAEDRERKKIYNGFRFKGAELWMKIYGIWQTLSFSQRILISLTQFIIFLLSFYFIQRGEMTLGELVMFNGYAAMLFSPFVTIGNNWQIIQNGLVAIARAEKVLAYPTENYVPKNAVILSGLKGEVTFSNVSFSYESRKQLVLDDISFKVSPGEKVALVGESGVGKTTLVDLIPLYHLPTKGKVLIDGHDVKNLDLKTLRSQIAVVSQEVVLFNETIKKNISYGNFGASLEKIKAAAKMAHADEFIEKFTGKYNQLVGERGVKLSVGQKQRVAIARAVLRDPRILILDEPTSALDAVSERKIQESLEKLMEGRTTFIIAHRLSTARNADKILVLDKGKIVEVGKHEDLINRPSGVYRKFYELQTGLV